MKNKKLLSMLLAILTLFSSISFRATAHAEGREIEINSESDFIQFIFDCEDDSYSKGLTVNLKRDLDFKGYIFVPVPIFYGTFNGRNHEIKIAKSEMTGSKLGLFRINAGEINKLTVNAKLSPDGSAENIGLIAGENQGIIRDCYAKGEIKAKKNAGGIAGRNTETGEILDSDSRVKITTTLNSGGIAGENSGLVEGCKNFGEINTSANQINPSKLITLDDVKDEFLGYENTTVLDVFSNAGGVAGRNFGTIKSSKNYASIGYVHLGHNVGGIAGLSDGIINDCLNDASISGRKNVGGITGQFEPDITFEKQLENGEVLKQQISELLELFRQLNYTVDKSSKNALDKSNKINKSIEEVESSLKNTGTGVNEFSKEKIDIIYESIDKINNTNNYLLDDFLKYSTLILSDTDTSKLLVDDIIDELDTAINNINENIDESNEDISASRDELIKQKNRLLALEENFTNINNNIKDKSESINTQIDIMNEGISELSETLKKVDSAATLFLYFEDINKSINKILKASMALNDIFTELLNSSTSDVETIIEVTFDAIDKSSAELSKINDSLSNSSSNIVEGNKAAQKNINTLRGELSDSLDSLNKNTSTLNEIANKHLKIDSEELDKIEENAKAEFDYVNSSLHSSYEDIYKNVQNINTDLNSLIDDGKINTDDISSNNAAIINEIDAIVNSIENMLKKPEYSYENIFDYDEGLKKASIIFSENTGEIKADLNSGGIAGEISYEPENNPEKLFKENAELWRDTKAILRAIVYSCENTGKISTKTDFAGGIVGRADTGTIVLSINKGNIEGKDYLGGISGYCLGKIEDCDVLTDIKGQNSLGGIAGYCSDILKNTSMVRIYSEGEKIGSIAGSVKDDSIVEENIFLNEYIVIDVNGVAIDGVELAAIDGINYEKKAYPVDFEDFRKMPEVPDFYLDIFVRFFDGDKLVKKVAIEYCRSLKEADIPPTPFDENTYSKWSDFNKEHIRRSVDVNLEHLPYISSISSTNGIPIFLAEGKFFPEDTITTKEIPLPEIFLNDKKEKVFEIFYKIKKDKAKAFSYEINTREDVNNGSFTLRVKIDNEYTIKEIKDGQLKDIEYVVDGSYAVFKAGAKGEILRLPKEDISMIFYILIPALIIILILILVIRKIKINKSKKAKNKVENTHK